MVIHFFTHNKFKFIEAQEIAKEYKLVVKWKDKEYEEIQSNSIEEIASNSCRRMLDTDTKNRDIKFFLEDAGLFIQSLKGFPGPYSAYVFKTIGNKGILELMKKSKKREAYFKSVIAYYDGVKILTFIGKTEGRIIKKKLGGKGFGFDPIFQPEGTKNTFAQMSLQTKNLYSHRQKSLRDLFTSITAFHKNQ